MRPIGEEIKLGRRFLHIPTAFQGIVFSLTTCLCCGHSFTLVAATKDGFKKQTVKDATELEFLDRGIEERLEEDANFSSALREFAGIHEAGI